MSAQTVEAPTVQAVDKLELAVERLAASARGLHPDTATELRSAIVAVHPGIAPRAIHLLFGWLHWLSLRPRSEQRQTFKA